jgi:hypothetical protein
MSTFAPTALPRVAPSDPSKHVNYSLGMVLGVDDFKQEHTHVIGRTERVVRDVIGYGVVYGLRVTVDVGERGARVQVSPGEGVVPSGRLVCVSPAQCAYLNDWLEAHRDEVERLGSPPTDLPLSVVACYRECPTDDVPIPGEPCRSDDELMAPSRLKESFSLELRLTPLPQLEEDACRDFVHFVRSIPVVGGAGGNVETFIETLRSAIGLELSPPSSPPGMLDFLFGSPPAGLEIPREHVAEYIAALFRFWAEDLRPLLRSGIAGAECGCGGAVSDLDPDADCLTLATLDVPIVIDSLSGELLVADTPDVGVDETSRPWLLHLRMLQEWLLVENGSHRTAFSARVLADGSVVAGPTTLAVMALEPAVFLLTFPEFDPSADYLVVGTPIPGYTNTAASTFELLPSTDADLVAAHAAAGDGIVVRVQHTDGTPVANGFTVHVEQLGVGS